MKKISVVIFSLLIAQAADAGVAEKKETKKIQDGLNAKAAEVKKWCGNAALAMEVTVAAKWKQNEIRIARTNILGDFFAGLKAVCKDADYRAELRKLRSIAFSLTDKNIKGSPKGVFTRKGAAMKVVVHVRNSLSNGTSSSVPNAIKKLY